MGFITKKQMDFQDQIYDLVDSDVGEEVDRHLNETNPNVDRIKRGVFHRLYFFNPLFIAGHNF